MATDFQAGQTHYPTFQFGVDAEDILTFGQFGGIGDYKMPLVCPLNDKRSSASFCSSMRL